MKSFDGPSTENHGKGEDNPLSGLSELQLLRQWFDNHPSDAKGWRVLSALLDESLKKLSVTVAVQGFTDEELCQAAGLDEFNWHDVTKWWSRRQETVHRALLERGATGMPYPVRLLPLEGKGGRGNKASNVWHSQSTSPESGASVSSSLGPDEVFYAKADVPAACLTGFFRRLTFRRGEIRKDTLRFKVLRWRAVLSAVLVMAFCYLSLNSLLLSDRSSVSPKDIALILAGIGLFWLWLEEWSPLRAAFADRIAPVPGDWLKPREEPVQLEWRRTATGEVLKLVRYSAVCPVCGAPVWLASGEPEWPKRMFGRCSDAPREHVLTFDPVSLRGRLRHQDGSSTEGVKTSAG